jgi:vacuolar-type H+-ATPase subunit H
VLEIFKNTKPENSAADLSLDEYQGKIEELLVKENNKFRLLAEQQAKTIINEAQHKADLILSQTQKKNAEYIGAGEQKAAEIVGDSYKKAEKIVSKAHEESDSIIAAARQEASSIVANGRKDAEQQALDTIERLKKEADSLIRVEIEKCSSDTRVQSSRIYADAKNDAQKLINIIMENSKQAQFLIIESANKTESIMAKARENVQTELDDLTRRIAEIKNNLEQLTHTIIREKDKTENTPSVYNNLNPGERFWIEVKGDKSLTANGENGYTRGKIELKVSAPYNAERVRLLKKSLTQVPGIKNLGESSSEEGIIMKFELLEKLPLVDTIKSIIPIEKVEKEGYNLKLTLK